jgi:DNA-binding transcriptional LysR family regulator
MPRAGCDLASGALICLLPKWSPSFPGLCLYHPSNRHPPTALRLLVQTVRDWASRHRLRNSLAVD